ncbi:transcriptional regulator [Skermania sp. ID1734]|uniref:helix-turn-helix domain-containing protein n=1 Tax=Skermania sp. ID1734 TaxID=2597516 RepID=UPI00117DCF60|nr:helix-turn-helix domain-containing protein [Skermania sp. ID1734]TSD93654.1 transcriptional regulator [Skermania sp. ID1734]
MKPITHVNPWVALYPGLDIDMRAQQVATARESFLNRAEPAGIRSVVLDSWLRSRANGVDPDRATNAIALAGVELEKYRSSHPMALIRPVVQNLLVEDAADTGLLVAISDEHGRLLWVEGDSDAKDRALEMNFAEGVDWSEGQAGTNAPGTALALDHCVQIFGAEHFNSTVHQWSCSAAPVHDPNTGRILGAIDITGGPRVAVPEVLSLIRATVAAAESELRFHLLNAANLGAEAPRLEVLGGTNPGLVRGAERSDLSRRHAEILLLLSEHPEGLASDQLAVLLDESELDAVTIRAEVSRLRRVVGAANITSRPYRLSTELTSDIADLRHALDRGDVSTAMSLYTGPLLPGSDSPGVADIRDELRTRMRAALLRAGDPRLLARWTTSVEGREDATAWTAYLRTLDPKSPLYSQVKARIDLLDRRYR